MRTIDLRSSRSLRRFGVALLGAAIVATLAVTPAFAHLVYGSDGRIPGKADYERRGNEIHRYDPATNSYVITSPGEPPLRVHGDPPPPTASAVATGPSTPLPTQEDAPLCVNSGHRIKVVWSHPTGAPSSSPALIQSIVRRMNWKLRQEADRSSSGTRIIEMKVECNPDGTVKVHDVPFGGNEGDQIRENVENTLGKPGERNAVKYLVFRDSTSTGAVGVGYGYTGAATTFASRYSVKSASDNFNDNVSNFNRVITTTAIIWHGNPLYPSAWQTHVALHELSHTLGATQYPEGDPAPFAGVGSHCRDGIDALCYSDEGGIYSETRCPANGFYNSPSGVPVDCGYDTYFDTSTETGEWLSRYWNVGGPENPYLGTAPSQVDGDVDGDGYADLVTHRDEGTGSGPIRVFRGSNSGAFAAAVTSESRNTALYDGVGYHVVDIADVTGDGLSDLIQVGSNGWASLNPGKPNGEFSPLASSALSFSGTMLPLYQGTSGFEPIAVADVSGDGRADFVAHNAGNEGVYVYRGEPNGTFASGRASFSGGLDSALSDKVGHYMLDVADVDGDAHADLVTWQSSGQVNVFRGKGSGGLNTTSSSSLSLDPVMDNGGGNEPLGVGDVNGDGRADLVVKASGGAAVTYLGQLNGSLGSGVTSPSYTHDSSLFDGVGDEQATILDANGDGRGDLVVARSNGTATIYRGQSNGTLGSPTTSLSLGTLGPNRFGAVPGDQLVSEKPVWRRKGCAAAGCP